MLQWRIGLAAAGLALLLFGAFRLVTGLPFGDLVVLAVWLVAAVAIHDGLLSPVVVAVGVALTRVPPRGRRYLQGALIAGGLITVVAIPLIHRRHSQPAVKALLLRDYGADLTLLLGLVGAVALALYAVRVARDRS